MRRDALLVEFVGLPGAGKSALSRRLAEVLQAQGLAVDEPSRALAHGSGRGARALRKLLRVALESLARPLASARAARAIAASGQAPTAGAAHLWFNWLLVSSLARRARRRAGVHLLDEGPCQGAWSVALEGDPEAARALLSGLPAEARPDLLVVVEAPAPVVAARIRARSERDSRLDRRLDAEPELLQRAERTLIGIRSALESAARPGGAQDVFVLANVQASDLDRGAGALAERILAALRRSGTS
jgi:thymidylate kinase